MLYVPFFFDRIVTYILAKSKKKPLLADGEQGSF